MTAKEKAKELFDKYYQLAESIQWTDNETKVKAEKFNDELGTDVLKYWNELAKQSALVAVDEMLYWTNEQDTLIWLNDFYSEVKQEITQL